MSLPPDVRAPKDAEDLLRQGVDLFNRQDYRKAIEKLNQANDKFDGKSRAEGGNYAEALVYRGRAEQSLGLDKEAVKSFQRALQLRPSDFETKTLLAEARFNAVANLDQVEKDLREVIAAHPDFAFARVVLADLLHYLGKPRQAEWELRLAINDDPNYPAAYLALADALTYQASPDKQKKRSKCRESGSSCSKSEREEGQVLDRAQAALDLACDIRSRQLRKQQRDGRSTSHAGEDPNTVRAIQLEKTVGAGKVRLSGFGASRA
jgi:tetratricopeptide (TPR) repeat protein